MSFTPSGYTPDSAETSLENVQTVFINTFGSTFILSPTTINGVFIQELTDLTITVQDNLTLLYTNIYNPNLASNIFLDSIASWSQITRKAATPSTATCTCTGLSGTIIPEGSQILNTNGDVFESLDQVTIPISGNIDVEFQSIETGAIACSANTLTRIVVQLSGWDTVNNSNAGTLGEIEETDTNLRYRRNYTLALNSAGSLDAINSACANNLDIINYYTLENIEITEQTIEGIVLQPKSIWLSVYGGTDEEIAQILATKKSAGAAMNGNTSYIYTNPTYTWQTFYAVWQRPIETPILINVEVINTGNSNFPSSTDIQNAIYTNFYDGYGNQPKVKMGVTIYASRFYISLTALGIYDITVLDMALVSTPSTTATTLYLTSDKIATLDINNIYVTIG